MFPKYWSVAYRAVSYWTVSETLVLCGDEPIPEPVTVTVYAPDGVPKLIWLLPPPPPQLQRVTPKKMSTTNPSDAAQRLLGLGTPNRKMQTRASPALAAK